MISSCCRVVKFVLQQSYAKHVTQTYVRTFIGKDLKRFYKNVTISKANGGFEVNLDKHKLKTPMSRLFKVPTESLAVAVATEWDSQVKVVKRHNMYLTSLCNAAIDNPTARPRDTVINSVIEFLDTDTICYRVDEPVELAELQSREWDLLLHWLQERYGVVVEVTTGISQPHVPASTRDVFRQHLNSYNDWALVGYFQAVDSIKSFIIATALIDRHLTVEQAVKLARLEQEYQISFWGKVEWHHDVEQMEMQSRLAAATLFVHLCTTDDRTVFNKQSSGTPV